MRRLTGLFFFAVAAAILVPVLFSAAALGQRLPHVAIPEHYSLKLTPNLKAATFTGEETIQLTLEKPTDSITLNAIQIKFQSEVAEVNGKTLPATVTLDPAKQQATFHFSQTLPAGPVTLKVEYSGILNSQLRGFYLSKAYGRKYAVTQFEPTDARRAFPCFDEPGFKATFDVTLIVPKGDMAISNANIVSNTPGPGPEEHTVHFARTPKMSTYLVAFLVGDFQCLSGSSDGVPIRVCATPEQVNQGHFALSAAEFFLHYYDDYFGIKYPMPKLDLVAIPDFEAGAMENFGAITFRETALLLDPETASIGAKKLVAIDVAHEMAHQWFGDMVTMNWWDNIWLNEGFATWMEHKPVALWKPQWHIPQDVALGMNTTLDIDAQRITRTIRAEANTPAEINEMFDAITYNKAGAVLLMVENYLGDQTFRAGVHKYLEDHMYGNATAQDFWNTQTEVSHKPVDKIMESFVTEPGEPLLTFGPVHDGKVEVSQQRFFLNPTVKSQGGSLWTVPVCLKQTGTPECEVLSRRKQTLNAPPAPVFYANAEGKGYYRDEYDRADYRKLVSSVESALDPSERIILLGSQWALTRAGKLPLDEFMNLETAVKGDSSADVLELAAGAIRQIDQQIVSGPEEHRRLASWVRKTFEPPYQRLGAPKSSDPAEKKQLRATLFYLLGTSGEDPAILGQATKITNLYLSKPSSVDPTLAAAAAAVAARNGDAALFERLQKVSQKTRSPQLRSQTLYSLALFRNPKLLDRALDYAVSGKVRNQDSARLIVVALSNRETQDTAWRFVKQNWPKVQAQLTVTTGEYLVGSTGHFCSADRAREVSEFFAQHPVPASEADLSRAIQNIGDCVTLRKSQSPNLERWLRAQ